MGRPIGCTSVLLIRIEPIVYWDLVDFCQSLQSCFLKTTQNDGDRTEMGGKTLTEIREMKEELFGMCGENYRGGGVT